MRDMPRSAQAYVLAVACAGLAVVVAASVSGSVNWASVAVLGALYWFADSREIITRTGVLGVSASSPVALASLLLLGAWGGALVCAVSALAYARHAAWFKHVFNGAQAALSAAVAGGIYHLVPGAAQDGFAHASFPAVLPAVAVAGLSYFVLNNLFVAVVVRLTTDTSMRAVWWNGVAEMAIPSLGYGSIGLIVAVLWVGGVGPVAALLVLAPLVIARWAFEQYSQQHAAYDATVRSLIQAVETKDYYTRGHSERVASASVLIAQQLGMREDRLEMLRYAGMLHDVGKLGVPTKLLQKTGPLDDDEFASIKLHPTRGFEMVNGISFLEEATLGIRHHHERVDGRGYPDGLAGDEIPEFARLIAVADAFDSMTSTRSYRGARSVDAAIRELRRWAGTQFDAGMVEALVVAVGISGWQASVDATDDVVDPALLVFRDHDDPSSDIAAGFAFETFGVHDEQQVS
ncbi:MAG TPA: HD-GYP domain-containing protein [Acidothermaceae bacterium]